MTKLTYTQNRLTGQYIIQLILDPEDLKLPKLVPVEQRGLSVSEHLIYLAHLTAAIDAAQSEEENMIDTIMNNSRDEDEGPVDLPDDDVPTWDEDESEEDNIDDDPGPTDEDYLPGDDADEDAAEEIRDEEDEEELE